MASRSGHQEPHFHDVAVPSLAIFDDHAGGEAGAFVLSRVAFFLCCLAFDTLRCNFLPAFNLRREVLTLFAGASFAPAELGVIVGGALVPAKLLVAAAAPAGACEPALALARGSELTLTSR